MEPENMTIYEQIKCGNQFSWCRCELPPGHDGAHECHCEGSWLGDEGERVVRTFPGLMRRIYPTVVATKVERELSRRNWE